MRWNHLTLFMPVSDALRAIASGDASAFFDRRRLENATGLLLVAVPVCPSGDASCARSQTSPLFAQMQDEMD